MANHDLKKRNTPARIAGALICLALTSGAVVRAQTTTAPATAESKKSATDADPKIKVTFDETAPGVLIVESNGERIRIDIATKSVTRLADTTTASQTEAATEEPSASTAQIETETEEKIPAGDDSLYDYRLVSLLTPKIVPKHAINTFFTHRFSQPVRPFSDSGRNLLGLDSFSVSSFGVSYGITDRFYLNAYRSPLCQTGMCKTVEIGAGFHVASEKKGGSPVTLALYGSVEGNDNFTEEYTFNFQAQIARSVTRFVNVFFNPSIHFNSNGQHRFNPRPEDFYPSEPKAALLDLGRHTGTFGVGVNARIRPTVSLIFEVSPRVGFKLGRVDPIYDNNFRITGFRNESHVAIGLGVQKDIGRHSFTLTFSNNQGTTTSRSNSSNLFLSPKSLIVGFNLWRRM